MYSVNQCQQQTVNKMLTLEQIRKRLEDMNLSKVAKKVGCTRTYLHYVATGKQAPKGKGEVMQRLSDYLEARQ